MQKEYFLRLFWPAVLLTVLALPFIYHTSPSPAGVRASSPALPVKTLTIVSPHWEGVRSEFTSAFSSWTELHFGHQTRIDWLDVGGTSDGVKYVRSEFKRTPDGINVDMFFGGGIDPYLQFKKENLLQRVEIPREIISRIPPDFQGVQMYDPEMQWFGACLGGFGIIYNIKVLEMLHLPIPQTWKDLARPEYFTWIGSGDPRSSGSVHMVYEIILQAYGWDEGWRIITAMSGNIRNFTRSGSDTPRDTAIGEVACGLAIDVYAWRQQAEAGSDIIGFVFPSRLTVINPDAMAVFKGAPELELARQFITFTLSESGQKLWILKAGTDGGPSEFELTRMPVIPDFASKFQTSAAITADAFRSPAGLQYDAEKGSARWTILNDLIGASIIDPHPSLVAAWRKIKDSSASSSEYIRFTSPPLSEVECMRLASSDWNDQARRAAIKSEWTSEAVRKYKALSQTK